MLNGKGLNGQMGQRAIGQLEVTAISLFQTEVKMHLKNLGCDFTFSPSVMFSKRYSIL